MDGTQLVKGVLDLAVLAVVAPEDGYGYDVVRRLRAGARGGRRRLGLRHAAPALLGRGADLVRRAVRRRAAPQVLRHQRAGAHGARDAKDVGGVRRHDGRSADRKGDSSMSETLTGETGEVAGLPCRRSRESVDRPGPCRSARRPDRGPRGTPARGRRPRRAARPLESSLGSPSEYAAELRASAGLPARGGRGAGPATARARLDAVLASAAVPARVVPAGRAVPVGCWSSCGPRGGCCAATWSCLRALPPRLDYVERPPRAGAACTATSSGCCSCSPPSPGRWSSGGGSCRGRWGGRRRRRRAPGAGRGRRRERASSGATSRSDVDAAAWAPGPGRWPARRTRCSRGTGR